MLNLVIFQQPFPHHVPLTESDREVGPIEAKFMVPVSCVSAEDFTDIISKHHMVNQNVHIWLAEK